MPRAPDAALQLSTIRLPPGQGSIRFHRRAERAANAKSSKVDNPQRDSPVHNSSMTLPDNIRLRDGPEGHGRKSPKHHHAHALQTTAKAMGTGP